MNRRQQTSEEGNARGIQTLRAAAVAAVSSADLDRKTSIAAWTFDRWSKRSLSLRSPLDPPVPDRPGRPDTPALVPPRMVPKRNLNTMAGRAALLHALAHIELNALDLALDIVARFAREAMPLSFFDGWMRVAADEARHFLMVRRRLNDLGADYGDMPAHDGLWQAAQDTRNDLTARLAVVPLILEARGLDVTPALQLRLQNAGDQQSAAILDVIYRDEINHVAIGAKWFRFLCHRTQRDPARTFQELVRANFRGNFKPPYNDIARAQAGLTPSFYRSLSTQNMS